ncbi:MAG: L-rhamnose mutarotase [Pirellulales bacterium]
MNGFVSFVLVALVAAAGQPATGDVTPVYGTTNPAPGQIAKANVKTYASIVELRPEKEQAYRKLHADVWPEVVATIKKANIRNYNIYVVEIGGRKYLFSHLEYVGDDPAKDFAQIANDPTTRDKWWPATAPCQKRLPGTADGEQWLGMEMLMHID